MPLELSVGLVESSAMFCVHVHASDASVGLSSLFGSPTRGSAHLVGKSRITDVSDTFTGLFELPASLSVCVHVLHVRFVSGPFWLFHARYCAFDR